MTQVTLIKKKRKQRQYFKSPRVYILLTYGAHEARRLRPFIPVCHRCDCSFQECHPSWFLSFSTVLLHGSLGRPCFLLPSGAHVGAVLEMLTGLVLNMYPIHRHLFTRIRADTGVLPVASKRSLLIRWLAQNFLSTLLKQVRRNRSTLLRSVVVTLHISAPYSSTDSTCVHLSAGCAAAAWPPDDLKSGECSSS